MTSAHKSSGHRHAHDRRAHAGMPKIPSWLTVEEALARILDYVSPLGTERKPLLEARGQVLAEDVRAPFDVPPHANSSMDGYAVRAADVGAAGPSAGVSLRVVGEAPAGAPPSHAVHPGEAVRIMTGAVIPEGADAVVPFEETDELERIRSGPGIAGEVNILAAAADGENIRLAGEDVAAGETVLPQGATLGAAEIGVLASLGLDHAIVIRRPVVAVLTTGDELVEPPLPLTPGKIYNSNGFSIAAAVSETGGVPFVLETARDNLASLQARLAEALEADIVLTTAGVSRGDYDIVKDVLMQEGDIDFWTVRMRPAKPLAFGALRAQTADGSERRIPHLGLPGNPVSALVAFEQFARPAMLKAMGKTRFDRPTVQAVLDEPIHNTDERRVYARAVVTRRDGQYHARLTGNQSSGVLTSMARANGLAICPEDVPVKHAGEVVTVQMLTWPEEGF